MSTPQPSIESFTQKGPRESLSQLIAKILDQLSVSAWLPAGALVLGTLLLVSIRLAGGDLAQALRSLAGVPLGGLVLLVIAVVLATMLTQAFGFGSIRLLEGYWGHGPLRSRLVELRCRRHARVRTRLQGRKVEFEEKAFQSARRKMRRVKVSARLLDILEESLSDDDGSSPSEVATEQERSDAASIPWQDYADGAPIRRADALLRRIEEYPEAERRIMPTRFGNILRAYEERAYRDGGRSLTGWIMREFHRLPTALQSQHDEHRSRVELYSILVILSLMFTIIASIMLYQYPRVWAWSAGLSLLGAWISHRAVLASARGYGDVLVAVGEWRDEQEGLLDGEDG